MSRDILVPVDFSDKSLRALDAAVELAGAEGQVYLLHVVDEDFVQRASEAGLGAADAIAARLRQRADQNMQELLELHKASLPAFNSLVVLGKPFVHILRMAHDLDFDVIVLATHGRRGEDLESLLFGSTAEKVLRGSRVPVLCVPAGWQTAATQPPLEELHHPIVP